MKEGQAGNHILPTTFFYFDCILPLICEYNFFYIMFYSLYFMIFQLPKLSYRFFIVQSIIRIDIFSFFFISLEVM